MDAINIQKWSNQRHTCFYSTYAYEAQPIKGDKAVSYNNIATEILTETYRNTKQQDSFHLSIAESIH